MIELVSMYGVFVGFALGLTASIVFRISERSRYDSLLIDAKNREDERVTKMFNEQVYPLKLREWERDDRYPGRRARPVPLIGPPKRTGM